MNVNTIIKKYNMVCDLVVRKRLKEALDLLQTMIDQAQMPSFQSEWEKHSETYRYILKYAVSGMEDPQQSDIYYQTMRSIIELADKVKYTLLPESSPSLQSRQQQREEVTPGSDLDDAVQTLTASLTLDDFLDENKDGIQEDTETEEAHIQAIDRIFDWLWLTEEYSDKEKETIDKLFQDENFQWYERSVLVTAITLSLLRTFDLRKFNLLFDIYREQQEQVWQRAIVGILFALYRHNKRFFLYPELRSRLETEYEQNPFETATESTIIQLLKAKDTDRITKKLQDEIMPDLMKMQPKIQEKLNLDKILGDEEFNDQNPDWQEFFKDSPGLMDKLQELSDMQMDGNDVFMATFAKLKNFPFFNRLSNWFLPFYKGNSTAEEALKDENAFENPSQFIEAIANSHYMCNSDKYSFCLNMQYLPDQQKQMMSQMLQAEFEQMKEVSDDEAMVDQSGKTRKIITQYIQDLYRFFKLHSMRGKLDDIFSYRMDYYNKDFYPLIVKQTQITRNIAEYYFAQKHFDKATEIFEKLIPEEDAENLQEIFEKLGYAYEKQEQFLPAIDYYKKAELFENNRLWNQKKIANCYRMLGQQQESINYYEQAEKLAPEDIYVKVHLGHTYLDMENYERAMEYYHKAERIAPGNYNIWRPISWCAFAIGKFEQAEHYLNRLMEHETTRYDYINAGHIAFCRGEREKAANLYLKSIEARNNDMKEFLEAFKDDKKHLLNHGITEDDIALLLDYVRYGGNNEK